MAKLSIPVYNGSGEGREFGVTRLNKTKPKYQNENEIPERTIKNIGNESNLHLWHWFLVLFW